MAVGQDDPSRVPVLPSPAGVRLAVDPADGAGLPALPPVAVPLLVRRPYPRPRTQPDTRAVTVADRRGPVPAGTAGRRHERQPKAPGGGPVPAPPTGLRCRLPGTAVMSKEAFADAALQQIPKLLTL